MSSAVAGYSGAFGYDGPPAAYADIGLADCLLLLGTNTAACHPIVWSRIRERRSEGACVICVDPRPTPTARESTLHLPVRPGTDLALLNAMLHVIDREGLVDEAFVARSTSGWEEALEVAREWSPRRAGEVCGVEPALIEEAARRFGTGPRSMALWSMGANQSRVGTLKNRALINLCLASGQIGRRGDGAAVADRPAERDGGPGDRRAGPPAARLPARRGRARPGRDGPAVGARRVGGRDIAAAGTARGRAVRRPARRHGEGGLDRRHQPGRLAARLGPRPRGAGAGRAGRRPGRPPPDRDLSAGRRGAAGRGLAGEAGDDDQLRASGRAGAQAARPARRGAARLADLRPPGAGARLRGALRLARARRGLRRVRRLHGRAALRRQRDRP